MLFNDVQYLKALSSMVINSFDNSISFKFSQAKKACDSIVMTLLGIIIDSNPKQRLKAPLPIVLISLGIIVFLHPAIILFVFVSMIAEQLFLESYFALLLLTLIEVNFSQ